MRIWSIVLAGAGLAIGSAALAQGPAARGSYDDEVTYHQGDHDAYEGRWTGTWRDKDGKSYSGEYEGRFEGHVRQAGVDYDAPPIAGGPRWSPQPVGPGERVVTTTQAPGYFAGGYYYPGVTTTTVVIQPATTVTETYVTETVPVRRRLRRR